MKRIKLTKVLALLAISLFIFTSCEDEKGLTSSDIGKSQGFIEVELNGESSEGEDINEENFKATKFNTDQDNYNSIEVIDEKENIYSISIRRTVNVTKSNNYSWISILYHKDKDSTELTYFEVGYRKKLDEQTILSLYFDKFGFNNHYIIDEDNFEFNEDTYEISGEFTVNHKYDNDNELEADVNFEAQPKKIIN